LLSYIGGVPTRLVLAAVLCACALAMAQEPEKPAPYIRTPYEVVERMLELADVRASDVVVDLGSGDGRIVIQAARRFGARGVGVERDPSLVARSHRNAAAAGVAGRVRFIRDDVLSADLSEATVVTAYLLPELMWKLRSRFLTELAPGARIVSHAFDMPGWAPDRVETMRVASSEPGQGATSRLYLWLVPANARGDWRSGAKQIRITQSYQRIEVEGATRATLRGRDIFWRGLDGSFTGRIERDRIAGRLETATGARDMIFVRVP
jgi:SAM-dependent methyltransferase